MAGGGGDFAGGGREAVAAAAGVLNRGMGMYVPGLSSGFDHHPDGPAAAASNRVNRLGRSGTTRATATATASSSYGNGSVLSQQKHQQQQPLVSTRISARGASTAFASGGGRRRRVGRAETHLPEEPVGKQDGRVSGHGASGAGE